MMKLRISPFLCILLMVFGMAPLGAANSNNNEGVLMVANQSRTLVGIVVPAEPDALELKAGETIQCYLKQILNNDVQLFHGRLPEESQLVPIRVGKSLVSSPLRDRILPLNSPVFDRLAQEWIQNWVAKATQLGCGEDWTGSTSPTVLYLNGEKIGETRGYLEPLDFDVDKQLVPGGMNTLALKIDLGSPLLTGTSGTVFPAFFYRTTPTRRR